MANTIRLKRSASAGKVPLASDLQLGELAVNTNDGRLYLKKDNGAASVVEVGPVTSVAGRTGTVTLAIPDVAELSASLIPVGAVIPYAGLSAPARWLFCFGQNVSRTTYAALFAAISTTYGAGNGSTTFTLPDLRGRAVAGQDDMGGTSANRLTSPLNGDTLGGAGGAESVTLTTAEMPAHKHNIYFDAVGYASGGAAYAADLSFATPNWDHVAQMANSGGGGAHANVQPTLILNYMIYAGV